MDRRKLLTVGGVGAAGAVAAGAVAWGVHEHDRPRTAPTTSSVVPFTGPHQAGIVTPAQDRLHFVAFDVITDDRAKLVDLLRKWTDAAQRMTLGQDAGALGALGGPPEAPPEDTGEALGLPPAALTLTFGFGTSLFRDAAGRDRFGILGQRPAAFADLPAFAHDALQPEISGGDLCVQACSNDPQVAVHAIRNLARIGFGVVSVRWSQLGFGRTSSTSTSQATPRNLFGFKDGTANIKAEEGAALDEQVWVQAADGAPWMAGGSYLVTRKIRMVIENWDRTSLAEQQTVIGRDKGVGAGLGQSDEFATLDFTRKGPDGDPMIPVNSHVRLAHPDFNNGVRLLRRGYNFVDGSDGLGRLNAGLFFMAYQRDPRRQFVAVQTQLARSDAMNEYVRHVSSSLFACPPGVTGDGGYWGSSLLS